jgi:hypothetical protein
LSSSHLSVADILFLQSSLCLVAKLLPIGSFASFPFIAFSFCFDSHALGVCQVIRETDLDKLLAPCCSNALDYLFCRLVFFVPESDDLHENMVATWFQIDLGIHGAGHEMAAVAAHHVVFLSLFLDTEFDNKIILATEALEVARVKLRKNNDYRAALRHVHDKFGTMVISRPGHVQCRPLLSDGPFGSKKTSAVEVLILLEQVVVGNPKELFRVKYAQERTGKLVPTPSLPNL